MTHPLCVPLRELLVLGKEAGHNVFVSSQSPQEEPDPDAALEHQQVLIDPARSLLCEPLLRVRRVLGFRDASRCSGIHLRLLERLELGFLLW